MGAHGRPERTHIDDYPDRAGAQARVEAILRPRLRHGYRILMWQ